MENKETTEGEKWTFHFTPGPSPKIVNTFEVNEVEEKRAQEFIKKHKPCRAANPTAIGGGYSYIFTPTSIATAVAVKCNICGEIKEVTDVDNW